MSTCNWLVAGTLPSAQLVMVSLPAIGAETVSHRLQSIPNPPSITALIRHSGVRLAFSTATPACIFRLNPATDSERRWPPIELNRFAVGAEVEVSV